MSARVKYSYENLEVAHLQHFHYIDGSSAV